MSETYTSRDTLEVGLLRTRSHGWQDMAVRIFSYKTRTVNWQVVKFDGQSYKLTEEKLKQPPNKIILNGKSPEFDLGSL